MSLFPPKPENPVDKLVNQVRASVDEISVKNLGLNFILIAINQQGQMVTVSTNGLPDPLTRISLLSEAIKAEAQQLQHTLHQAAYQRTVQLVQKSTNQMTKQ